jgi:PAS domain S-box-containing protein
MATILHSLIVDPDEQVAAHYVSALQEHGWRAQSVRSAASAAAVIADHPAEVILLGQGCSPSEQSSVLKLAQKSAAVLLLGVSGADCGAGELELALHLGCAAVFRAGADAAVREAALASTVERRRAVVQVHEEMRRVKFQSEELRRRCAQQAERFQESQETFFLDLSRMMTIITNIMDGIVFADRGGNVTLLNPVAEDLLGTKSFVAIGKPLSSLQGRHELVAALANDQDRLQGQKEIVQTVEVHHSEQDLLYIKCITSRVLDYRGQPAGTLSVLKDVTAEFKTDQLKNQYLSIVAHELRTPLTGIKTFSTMLSKGTLGELTERQHRVCESIREQSVRLEHQIDKLINLGNLESADYGQDREVIPVAEFAAGLLAPFEQSTRDRRIELTFQVDETEHRLFADRADLRRACQALVENAVKFTADGGHVAVRIEASSDGVLFGVRDDGIGIDPRYQRRIFEKFFQVEDPLTRHHGGAGLGLFVARGIIEAHGSRIEVSSKLGQGADFTFALPVYRPAATASTAQVSA